MGRAAQEAPPLARVVLNAGGAPAAGAFVGWSADEPPGARATTAAQPSPVSLPWPAHLASGGDVCADSVGLRERRRPWSRARRAPVDEPLAAAAGLERPQRPA